MIYTSPQDNLQPSPTFTVHRLPLQPTTLPPTTTSLTPTYHLLLPLQPATLPPTTTSTPNYSNHRHSHCPLLTSTATDTLKSKGTKQFHKIKIYCYYSNISEPGIPLLEHLLYRVKYLGLDDLSQLLICELFS